MHENTVVNTNHGYRRLELKCDGNLVQYVKLLKLAPHEALAVRLLGEVVATVWIAPNQKRDYDFRKYMSIKRPSLAMTQLFTR